MAKNIVHIIGTGTIGEPLIGLFCDHAEQFGVDEVTFHKNTPLLTDRSKVTDLVNRRGAKLAVDDDTAEAFKAMGMERALSSQEALEQASVVIDCTPIGNKHKEKHYSKLDAPRGFIAQGSEFGFGKMYARGINDSALIPGEDRFLQVVSCNTHNLALLLQALGNADTDPENLVDARFLCIRRSNDISQDDSFVPSPMVDKHKDAAFGTHHARDVHHLYKTLGSNLTCLFSSAIKLNTQYMHTIYFTIKTRKATTLDEIRARFQENTRVAETHKTSVNSVFSFGRDHGHYGRILNQTVMVLPSLHVSEDGRTVTGFCFTPQDGNSLLSSVSATLWFLDPATYESRLQCLKPYFFDEV